MEKNRALSWLFTKIINEMQGQQNYKGLLIVSGDRGTIVVNVMCYISEGRWFDPSWCHGFFIDIQSFRSHYGPGVDSASNRNEYQEYFLGVKAAGA